MCMLVRSNMELAPKSSSVKKLLSELAEQLDDLIQSSSQLLSYIHLKFAKNFVSTRAQCLFLSQQPTPLNNGTLKQHQMAGLNWMISLYEQNHNGILADDMGLGKTIQAIAFMAYLLQYRKDRGPHLIIVPKTVMLNFQRECIKWLPCLNCIILPGEYQQRTVVMRQYINRRKFNILIATYESVISCFKPLSRMQWSCMVIDQAHKIKNVQSQRHKALSLFSADFTLLMTGTPIGVDITQLYALLSFIEPNTFNNIKVFTRPMQILKEFIEDEKEKETFTQAFSMKYQKILKPFMLRRTKKEVQKDLPPKLQKVIYLGMTSLQTQIYKQCIENWSIRGVAISHQQIQLRKICCHPYIFPHLTPDRLGKNVILASGKMIVLDKLLDKLMREDRRVLVFTQFLGMLRILQEYCEYRKYKYFTLEGATSLEERDEMINLFAQHRVDLFLLSTRAGNLGINLVAADTVVLYDSDWNPQMDFQAMDRAYRIGQTKQVHVYRLITQHTVEQKIHQVQKQRLLLDLNVVQKGRLFYERQADNFSIESYYNSLTFKPTPSQLLTDSNIQALIQRGQAIDNEINRRVEEKVNNKQEGDSQGQAFDLPLDAIYLKQEEQRIFKQAQLRKIKKEQDEERQQEKRRKKEEQQKQKAMPMEDYIDKLREEAKKERQQKRIKKREYRQKKKESQKQDVATKYEEDQQNNSREKHDPKKDKKNKPSKKPPKRENPNIQVQAQQPTRPKRGLNRSHTIPSKRKKQQQSDSQLQHPSKKQERLDAFVGK